MVDRTAKSKDEQRLLTIISISIGICILVANILNIVDLKITYNNMQLDIIQKATAAISCLLITQDDLNTSAKAGRTRIKVTLVAAIVALAIVSLDSMINNQWISIITLILGVIFTIILCKFLKAPFMSCRIGAISFVLISVTLPGQSRLIYALFRVISTIFGVVVVSVVSWMYDYISKIHLIGILSNTKG